MWDDLSMAERSEIMKIAVQGGVYNLDVIRGGYNEFAKGGNIYDGTNQKGQQMVTNRRRSKALRQILAEGKRAAEERDRNYLTASNDVTSVKVGRPQNRHLEKRAIQGAKQHATWDKEHPVLSTAGNVLGAVPFAVAGIPVISAAGEVAAPAVASALAPGSAFWMNPITQFASVLTPSESSRRLRCYRESLDLFHQLLLCFQVDVPVSEESCGVRGVSR